ncbi:MAG: matrixin family metalloprotease [Bdellovibrionales bacterium]|nr:matrixin family metalloprotease [Bdellovibrionales bacterium]
MENRNCQEDANPCRRSLYCKTIIFAEQNKDGEFHHTIFAHEVAHALGLDHTEIPGNLMTPGNAAVALKLNSEQIEKMRAQALIGPKGAI